MHKSCEKVLIYAAFSCSGGRGSIGVFRDLTIVRGSNLWICEEYYHNGRYLYITERQLSMRGAYCIERLRFASLALVETTQKDSREKN